MRLVELDAAAACNGDELAAELEEGNIICFPSSPILPTVGEAHILRDIDRLDTRVHKNVAYKPAQDKLTGLGGASSTIRNDVQKCLRTHSRKAIEFAGALLPRYAAQWQIDYASFRPQEE